MRAWPSNPAYEQAMARFQEGAYETALALLEEAQRLQPDRPRIQSNIGLTLMALGRLDEARAAAERGREAAEPDDPYPHQAVAQVMDRAGDSDGALHVLDTALTYAGCSDLDRTNLWIARAWALLHLGRDREAIADARRATELAPARSDAQLLRARALASANRWGEAMRIVETLLAAPIDEKEDALDLRNTIAKGLAIVDDMLRDARAEVARQPKRMEHWLNLGMALTMAGLLTEAEDAFDRAHEHNPAPDPWPDEPHMLSIWEADCRLARIMEHVATGSEKPPAPTKRAKRPVRKAKKTRKAAKKPK